MVRLLLTSLTSTKHVFPGAYIILFIACLYILVGRELRKPREQRQPIKKPLLIGSIVLYMAITLVSPALVASLNV